MRPSSSKLVLGLFGLLLLGSVVAFHDDYGITWDESVHARYGELALDYFESGGADARSQSYLDLHYYGPVVDLALAGVYRTVSPEDKWRLRHLVLGLLALLAVPPLWWLGRLVGGRFVGLLGPVLLFVMPRFHGHVFNNSKDVPFAVAMTWFLAVLADALSRRELGWRHGLGLGALFGITCSIRPGGFPILVGFLLLFLVIQNLRFGRSKRTARWAVAVIVVGWMTMVILWPAAHAAPLRHPLEAMRVASDFPGTYPVLFGGRYVMSDALPWDYLPRYLLITTPLPLLIAAASGLFPVGTTLVREPCGDAAARWMLIGVWLLGPVAGFVLFRPAAYDGLRHFLFVLPALALLAATGLAWLLREVSPRLRWGSWLAIAVVVLVPLLQSARLHPYQTSYFNNLVGGIGGAEGEYELDYWASSYREAADCLRERNVFDPAGKTGLLVAGTGYLIPAVRAYVPADVLVATVSWEEPRWPGLIHRDTSLVAVPHTRAISYPGRYDYYLATVRYGADGYFPSAPVVCRVKRGGATLSVVKRLTEPG